MRQYFSLYRAVSQREGEREEKRIDKNKNVQTTPTRTYYKRSRPLPYCYPNCRTPRPVSVLVVAPMGWCWGGVPKSPRIPDGVVFQKLGWCSKIWGGVLKFGVVLQKFVPESPMGWCSKSWGGAPKSCPRILDGVVFQKFVPESPRLDGVVSQKLGWCSKKLSQNPHGSIGWCSKSCGGVPKSCPRIPTLSTTETNNNCTNHR